MTPWIYIMGVCGWWAAGAVFIALVCRVINFSKFTKELREIQRSNIYVGKERDIGSGERRGRCRIK